MADWKPEIPGNCLLAQGVDLLFLGRTNFALVGKNGKSLLSWNKASRVVVWTDAASQKESISRYEQPVFSGEQCLPVSGLVTSRQTTCWQEKGRWANVLPYLQQEYLENPVGLQFEYCLNAIVPSYVSEENIDLQFCLSITTYLDVRRKKRSSSYYSTANFGCTGLFKWIVTFIFWWCWNVFGYKGTVSLFPATKNKSAFLQIREICNYYTRCPWLMGDCRGERTAQLWLYHPSLLSDSIET